MVSSVLVSEESEAALVYRRLVTFELGLAARTQRVLVADQSSLQEVGALELLAASRLDLLARIEGVAAGCHRQRFGGRRRALRFGRLALGGGLVIVLR